MKVDSAKVKDIDVVSPFTGGSVFGHFWVIAETPTGVTIFMKFSTRLKPKISILKLGDGSPEGPRSGFQRFMHSPSPPPFGPCAGVQGELWR